MTVGSANILVVHEELVEVRDAAHPPDSEQTRRWPGSNSRNEIFERCLLPCEPTAFREAPPGAVGDEPWRGEEVMFTQDELRRDVMGCPGIEERRSLWAELVQQIAELLAFDSVEKQVSHVDRL